MHPLLVLLAFGVAAVVIHVGVVAALSAASVIDDDPPAPADGERAHACC